MWRSENRAAYQLTFDEDYTPKSSFGRPRSHTYARTNDIQQKLVEVRPAKSHITYLVSHPRLRGDQVNAPLTEEYGSIDNAMLPILCLSAIASPGGIWQRTPTKVCL